MTVFPYRDKMIVSGWIRPAAFLYRTRDLEEWERVGPVELPPGVSIGAMAFARGRLYVGVRNEEVLDEVICTFHEPNASSGLGG